MILYWIVKIANVNEPFWSQHKLINTSVATPERLW